MDTIVTITGPTCSGKSTLAAALTKLGIPEVQSFTTRPPRSNEDPTSPTCPYKFVDNIWVAFQPEAEMIEKVVFLGNTYGNTRSQMLKATEKCGIATVVVEPNGVSHWAEAAKRMNFRHFSIFIDQPVNVLLKRFIDRWHANPDSSNGVELERLRSIIDVEVPTWINRHRYDLTIASNKATGKQNITPEGLHGFLSLSFGNG